MTLADSIETSTTTPPPEESSSQNHQPDVPTEVVTSMESKDFQKTHLSSFSIEDSKAPSLCIAVIGATGELARGKIFPALFALYYSGFLPEVEQIFYHCSVGVLFIKFCFLNLINHNLSSAFPWLQNVGIFGYSRKNLTDEELRSIIASTLTCRVDHQYDSHITYFYTVLEFSNGMQTQFCKLLDCLFLVKQLATWIECIKHEFEVRVCKFI